MITHFLKLHTYTILQLLAKKSLPLTELYEEKKKAKEHQEEILKAMLTYFTQAAKSRRRDMYLICLSQEMEEMDSDC